MGFKVSKMSNPQRHSPVQGKTILLSFHIDATYYISVVKEQ